MVITRKSDYDLIVITEWTFCPRLLGLEIENGERLYCDDVNVRRESQNALSDYLLEEEAKSQRVILTFKLSGYFLYVSYAKLGLY